MRNILIIITLFIISGSSSLLAQERGIASYYSHRMHGRRMSNGEKYHRDSLTCAHARYALGTLLRVTNPKNGKSVIVEVTDRCARHGRRIIDLSYAAAKELGIVALGVATVQVERYNGQAPLLLEKPIELPELDFEITRDIEYTEPAWKKK